MKKELTQGELQDKLLYRPTTGTFIWLSDKGQRGAGKIAGGVDSGTGYVRIRINGKLWQAHRLAWLYTYGELPKIVDHINGVRDDNRLVNLRGTDHKGNNQNREGVTGVTWAKDRYMYLAQITVDYKHISLGYFCDYEDALEARKQGEIKYGFINRKA